MPQEGYIMDSNGNLIPFFADRLTDEIRNNNTFYCKCPLQITANIPKMKGRKPYFSSKANSCHAKDCPYYHNHILEKVIQRIEPTGKNIRSLEDLLDGITSGGAVPEPRGEEGTPRPASPDEASPQEEIKLVIKKKDKPSSLIDLYELLKNPDIDTYAGHDPKELIIDRQSIPTLTAVNITGVRVAIVKRYEPHDKMQAWMRDVGIFDRAIVLRMPKDYPKFMEGMKSIDADRDIFFVIIFRDFDEKSRAFRKLTNPKYGPDPTFLVIANWENCALAQNPYSIHLFGKINRQAQLVYLPPDRNYDELTY